MKKKVDRTSLPEVRKLLSLYGSESKKEVSFTLFCDNETLPELSQDDFVCLYKLMTPFYNEITGKGGEV